MHAKDLEMVVLLDIYGYVLSDNRKNAMQLYYEEDLSLGEIAKIYNISRQAVHDSIKRGAIKLQGTEERLHLAEKYLAVKKNYEKIREAAELLEDSPAKENILDLIEQGSKII